ncbi:MAG: tol-pal system YbgF family protein [Sandaracinaceae bacterium]
MCALRRGLVFVLAGTSCLVVAHGVQAQEDGAEAPEVSTADEEARAHFQAAADAFQIADYATARREYEAAFTLSGRPEVMYQLYLCDERLGDLEGAIAWLERYLLEVADVPRRDTLLARLATMRERATPPEPPVEPPPPEPVETSLRPPSQAARETALAPPAPREDEPLLGVGVVSLSVAGLGFIGSATTGGLGLREQGRLAEECTFDVCPGSLRGVRDEADAFFLAADVLWIGSLALASVGVVMTVLGLTASGEGTP